MTTATVTPPPAAGRVGPVPKVWTVDEFHRLGDQGWFEGRGAKLINGQVIEEGPRNHPHATAATKTEDVIRKAFGKGWHVRVSKPLVLGRTTDPQPDAAVVRGRPSDYTDHPTTADLVVEVSDTSLKYDTTDKFGIYAAAGIAEYWVVDVNGRQLHVFRDPTTAGGAAGYATHQILGPADAVSPLAAPAASVRRPTCCRELRRRGCTRTGRDGPAGQFGVTPG